jgi:hypothetical protein
MSRPTPNSPPRPRLAIRVGVTGHRPNKLGEADLSALRRRIAEILTIVQRVVAEVAADPASGFRDGPPAARIISALAEGADRLVAEEGLRLGFELQVALPYSAELHAAEFSGSASYKEFEGLLGRATAVRVLDGAARDPAAYEAVGLAVLRNCDFLIAVWDGEASAKQGGTAQIARLAAERQMPTVRIDSRRPHRATLVSLDDAGKVGESDLVPLAARLKGLVLPPGAQSGRGGAAIRDLREAYVRETAVRGRLGRAYDLLLNLLKVPAKQIVTDPRKLWPKLLPVDYVAATQRAWKAEWDREPALPQAMRAPLERWLLAPHAWADHLATYYARRYRSAFTWTYVLAPVAVLAALWDYFEEPHHLGPSVWAGVEVAALVSIVGLYAYGKRRLWHERWLDYRSLAERLRHLTFLWPMDRAAPARLGPAHHAGGDPRATWVEWCVHAVLREAGLFQATMDAAYRNACRVLLEKEVCDEERGQVRYHRDTAARMRSVHHGLHRFATILFATAFLLSLAHFVPPLAGSGHKEAFTMLAAVLPALGAAIHGFLSQGDFQNLARRSEGMRADLEDLAFRLKVADTAAALGDLAEETAEVMGAELIDWRVGIEGKPPSLPA